MTQNASFSVPFIYGQGTPALYIGGGSHPPLGGGSHPPFFVQICPWLLTWYSASIGTQQNREQKKDTIIYPPGPGRPEGVGRGRGYIPPAFQHRPKIFMSIH